MKHFLLVAFIFTFVFSNAQQPYQPLLDSINIWHYTDNYYPVREQMPNNDSRAEVCQYPHYSISTQQTVNDTVINGNTYLQLVQTNRYSTNTCIYGYVREDTAERRVYFIAPMDTVESLLYNFSMQVGDSMDISFRFETMYHYYRSGTYYLDSITVRNITAGERRVFHLSNHVPGYHKPLTWIEGVGVLTDFIYTLTGNDSYGGMFANECNFAPHDYNMFVTCYSHAEPIYLDSCAMSSAMTNLCYNYENDCLYYIVCTGINEIASLSNITLLPNPAQENLTVSLDVKENSTFTLSVTDVNGRTAVAPTKLENISTGIYSSTFNIAHLPAGVYVLECKNESGAVYRKFIKQ